ncbi:MAG: NusG domain II-containing protein [Lachnospiraceae bacterium]|nr:NusG domain II-containing protein [Lachnospiraceae bacterium]
MKLKDKRKDEQTLFVILTATLIIIAIASVAGIAHLYLGREAGTYAEIYRNGDLIRTVSLDGSEDGVFTIYGEDGSFNTIEVSGGTIAVTDASCPDLLCVHMGATGSAALPIVCLPNGLVIQVKTDDGTGDEPDAVSY